MIRAGRADCGLRQRDRQQLWANLARSKKNGLQQKRAAPAICHRWTHLRLLQTALTQFFPTQKLRSYGLKIKPFPTLLHLRKAFLPLRDKLARSRESSGRTARSPDPRNVCDMTVNRYPAVELPQAVRIPILALPAKRRRRTASVWKNQSSAWKKAAKS